MIVRRFSCAVIGAVLFVFLLHGGMVASAGVRAVKLDGAAVSSAPEGTKLELSRPSWYTSDLHERVRDAGPGGVWVKPPAQQQATEIDCQGVAPNGVSAGACMVYPSGCTMNFIFADNNGTKYIGTAGHCAEKVGEDAVLQIGTRADLGTVNIAKVGTVWKTTGDGGVGNDFALIRIDPGFAVDPRMPIVGGPNGVFCGEETGQPLSHYGHGYAVTVQQGYPRVGVGAPVLIHDEGYGWAGQALPGDSGSGVVQAGGGQALGNLTHLTVFPPVVGTEMEDIMAFLGSSFSLVNADGSTSSGCGSVTGSEPESPVASFTYSCKGTTTCAFDGSGSSDDGTITSYTWNFGDGTTGTGPTVSHAYPAVNASYDVVLRVTDDAGNTDSEQKTVTCAKKGKNVKCG